MVDPGSKKVEVRRGLMGRQRDSLGRGKGLPSETVCGREGEVGLKGRREEEETQVSG